MEPVQRIPRYTLLFRLMIKHMRPDDPQRAKLIEADEIASHIALAETDENTKRAEKLFCLQNSIDGFPPGLLSNSRRFIDCIDVEDVADAGPGPASDAPSMTTLHCSLFLFDDKLMIVRRPSDKGGRALSGLDDFDKPVGKGRPLSLRKLKKAQMSCKGVVDITDVVATDVGGSGTTPFYLTRGLGCAQRSTCRYAHLLGEPSARPRRSLVWPAIPLIGHCDPSVEPAGYATRDRAQAAFPGSPVGCPSEVQD